MNRIHNWKDFIDSAYYGDILDSPIPTTERTKTKSVSWFFRHLPNISFSICRENHKNSLKLDPFCLIGLYRTDFTGKLLLVNRWVLGWSRNLSFSALFAELTPTNNGYQRKNFHQIHWIASKFILRRLINILKISGISKLCPSDPSQNFERISLWIYEYFENVSETPFCHSVLVLQIVLLEVQIVWLSFEIFSGNIGFVASWIWISPQRIICWHSDILNVLWKNIKFHVCWVVI